MLTKQSEMQSQVILISSLNKGVLNSYLVVYFVNTILKLFFDIYELHNSLCNDIIYRSSFTSIMLIGEIGR